MRLALKSSFPLNEEESRGGFGVWKAGTHLLDLIIPHNVTGRGCGG